MRAYGKKYFPLLHSVVLETKQEFLGIINIFHVLAKELTFFILYRNSFLEDSCAGIELSVNTIGQPVWKEVKHIDV